MRAIQEIIDDINRCSNMPKKTADSFEKELRNIASSTIGANIEILEKKLNDCISILKAVIVYENDLRPAEMALLEHYSKSDFVLCDHSKILKDLEEIIVQI